MFGGDYSQFIQTGTDPGKYYNQQSYSFQTTNRHNAFTPFGTDLDNHKQSIVMPKNFYKRPYPVDFGYVNPFCPICGKFIKAQDSHRNYESKKYSKNFLAHDQCLQKQEANNVLSTAYEQSEEAKIIPFSMKRQEKSIALGGQQYFLEMKISHTISDFVFLKQSSKVSSGSTNIKWQIHKDQETQPYVPTVICFPFSDFKLTLVMTCMATGQKTIYKSYINLGRLKYNEFRTVTASTSEIKCELKIFYTAEEKKQLVDSMNFKYRYPLDLPVPIVQITAIGAILPEEEAEDEHELDNSVIDRMIEDSPSQVSTIEICPSRFMVNNKQFSETVSERSYDKEKLDFDKLINSEYLGDYVRNNTQSRQFQTFLNEATAQQVDQIIQNLYMELPELIMHEYANYMVQKLFSVCNYTQRLKIMQRLHQDISNIVRNKQGTHTIQALIKFFTNDEEYKLMCQSIKQNFLPLSCHPNATHFIQKIIGLFPLIHTYCFFESAQKHFLELALDKNGMCVIKHMIKLIADLEKGKPSQKVQELISEAKKKFIHEVTFCIDKIIQDSFGNYVIQFCYQLFGEEKCAGITQMITERFPQFSLQKYSSSVVLKCVACYWTKKENFNRLKQTLTPEAIIELYRNKEGNKILLGIMERHDRTPITDKIYNLLVTGEPTKFNHDRWGVVLGIRSGTVGTEWSSFSDAIKKSSPYKQNNRRNRPNYDN